MKVKTRNITLEGFGRIQEIVMRLKLNGRTLPPGDIKIKLSQDIIDGYCDYSCYGGLIAEVSSMDSEYRFIANGDVIVDLLDKKTNDEIAYVKDKFNGGDFYSIMCPYIQNDTHLYEIIEDKDPKYIKNIMNDNYCHDMSVKIRTQLETKRKSGECVKNFAPYGYIKDPNDKHKLIIDEYAAFVVKEIFFMKLKGYSVNSIVDELNERGIKSPSEYKKSQNSKYTATLQRNSVAKWCTTEVRHILTDMNYCGSLVQGRITKPTFKCKKSKPVDKEKWIIVEDTHEAIISRAHFKAVERLLEIETRIPPSQKMVYPLSGMVRCGKCGGKMIRKVKSNKYGTYHYLICSNKLDKTCDMPMIPYNEAEDVVLGALQFHIRSMMNVNYRLQNQDNSSIAESINNILLMDINEKKNEIRAIENSLCFLHDKHLSGVLGDAEYSRLRKIKTAMLDEAEESLEILRKKHETSQNVAERNDSWLDIFKEYQNICDLKREAVALFIRNIALYVDKRAEVTFVYETELDELIKISENLKAEQEMCSEAV